MKRQWALLTLTGALFVSPWLAAEEQHHPDQDNPAQAETAGTEETAQTVPTPVAPGGMMMGGPGMMMGGPGMMKPGMMGPGMMQPGMMGGSNTGSIGGPGGMMGMMHQGDRGYGMGGKHRQMTGRLDLIDARLAKIEAMLERLLQR